MNPRKYSLICGFILVAVGMLGFVSEINLPHKDTIYYLNNTRDVVIYNYLFDFIPTNSFRNFLFIYFGLWGFYASQNYLRSKVYTRTLTFTFGIMTLLGTIPDLSTVFGLVPLYGTNVFINGIFSVICAYFGWPTIKKESVSETPTFHKAA